MASPGEDSDVDHDFFDDDAPDDPYNGAEESASISVSVKKSVSKSSSRSNASDDSHSRSRSASYSSYSKSSRSRSRSRSSSDSSRLSDAVSLTKSETMPVKRQSSKESQSSHFSSDSSSKASRSYSDDSFSKDDGSNKNGYSSESSSASDVTDVSPLHSPHGKPKVAARGYESDDDADSFAEEVQPRSRPPSGKKSRAGVKPSDSGDMINMRLLMEVLDLENGASEGGFERAKKVDFMAASNRSRKNYSFTNDAVDDIDRENQRLLHRIMEYRNEREKLKQQYERKIVRRRKPVMTSAAINRKREQERIERENLALLRRLQTTKATKTLRRTELLVDYCGKTIGGQSVAAAHRTRPKSAMSSFYYSPPPGLDFDETSPSAEYIQHARERRGRPSSATVVLQRDAVTPTSAGHGRRRPSSATNQTPDGKTRARPTSATRLNTSSFEESASRSPNEQMSRQLVTLHSRSDMSRKSSRSGRHSSGASAQ